jgi:hypothetical protein
MPTDVLVRGTSMLRYDWIKHEHKLLPRMIYIDDRDRSDYGKVCARVMSVSVVMRICLCCDADLSLLRCGSVSVAMRICLCCDADLSLL